MKKTLIILIVVYLSPLFLFAETLKCNALFLEENPQAWTQLFGSRVIRLVPIAMLKKFQGEADPIKKIQGSQKDRQNSKLETRVVYFNEIELKSMEFHVKSDGLFYDSNSQLLTTKTESRHETIFVVRRVGDELKMYFFEFPELNKYHHSSLAFGGDVLMAGELQVHNGKLLYLSSKSGHYEPSVYSFQQFMKFLESKKVDMDYVNINYSDQSLNY